MCSVLGKGFKRVRMLCLELWRRRIAEGVIEQNGLQPADVPETLYDYGWLVRVAIC